MVRVVFRDVCFAAPFVVYLALAPSCFQLCVFLVLLDSRGEVSEVVPLGLEPTRYRLEVPPVVPFGLAPSR